MRQARRGLHLAFAPALAQTAPTLDNVTHSLFGYALGRAANGLFLRGRGSAPRVERALLASSVLASNAPDLDFVTGLVDGDRQLTYLLDHRGFTHTVVFALAMGLGVGLACAAAYRVRDRAGRLAVASLGALACLLHVAFDLANDYGVHPFFPFDNRWYYGDSLFIIEPLLLAVLLPLPLWHAFTRAGRGVSAALALGLVCLVWLAGVPWASAAVTTAVLIGASVAQRRIGPRAAPPLIATAVLVAAFAVGSRMAEANVHEAMRAAAPEERVLDVASAPSPANPTCFRALVVSLAPDGTYYARLGRAQPFGSVEACRLLPSDPSAPLAEPSIADSETVAFDREFSAPASELAGLARNECDAAAMLRFVRVPFWYRRDDGTVLGDLRYDRGPGLAFAERLIRGVCNSGSVHRAPWIPPRRELLDAPGAG